ncbi:MAG: PTS sugar transporter subunit IIA [Alphaproteobacteria bacterium]|nr:PTS sugar transporter subunit IIA [Alphaproteobacteria bacterium]
MNISNILTEKNIFLGLKSGSKREFLQDLAQKASEICGVDAITIFDTVMERENLGTTGFGGGIAIPHGRFADVNNVFAFFAKPSYPVDFDAVDNRPVDLVFLLVSPETSGADHLTALALLSRILKDETTCNKLRKMSKTTEIYALLNEA